MTGRALVEQLLSKEESQHVEWCSVRPDSLVDAEISSYDIEASLTTGIFTGRPTARANVAHSMIELVENAELCPLCQRT